MRCAGNLKSLGDRTTDEQRKIARMGGKASGEARRRRKQLRELIEAVLAMPATDRDGTKAEAIAAALVERAEKGDTRAFELVRDTLGEKPVERRESSIQMENLLTKEQRDAAFRGAMMAME